MLYYEDNRKLAEEFMQDHRGRRLRVNRRMLSSEEVRLCFVAVHRNPNHIIDDAITFFKEKIKKINKRCKIKVTRNNCSVDLPYGHAKVINSDSVAIQDVSYAFDPTYIGTTIYINASSVNYDNTIVSLSVEGEHDDVEWYAGSH